MNESSAERPLTAGHFRLVQHLGEGNMGDVFLAEDTTLKDRKVAIKFFKWKARDTEAGKVERFDRELNALSHLSHPYIVKVYEAGTTQDGEPFVVMDYMRGGTLRDKLVYGPITEEHQRSLLRSMSEALDYMHGQANAVLHLDLKPENILFHESGSAHISDFGIAAIVANDQQETVTSGYASPGYTAPEVTAGRPADKRADIYSLAVIAWEVMTGERPDTENPQLGSDFLSSEMATVLRAAFSAVPDDRPYRTAGQLWQAVENAYEAPAPAVNIPYKGLDFFERTEANRFFGREDMTAELIRNLNDGNFLALLGGSGSGKSSLLRAGLIAALEDGYELAQGIRPPEGSRTWHYRIMTPGEHPLAALATALAGHNEIDVAQLLRRLESDSTALQQLTQELFSQNGSWNKLFLAIDQFEELFTLCQDESERRQFIDNLMNALSLGPQGNVVLALAIRLDVADRALQFGSLGAALQKQPQLVGAMKREELRQVIEKPARWGRWELEAGLVDRILKDVSDDTGSLPLLSHALLETWNRRRNRLMTLEGYESAGGVQGAIAHTAEAVYNEGDGEGVEIGVVKHVLANAEQRKIAKNIFIRLVRVGDETQYSRQPASIDELVTGEYQRPEVETVLNILASGRLITIGRNAQRPDVVEIAHEALIRYWPRLRDWLRAENDQEWFRFRERLSAEVREWRAQDQNQDYLFRGDELVVALNRIEERRDELNQFEVAFLEASRRAQEALERAEIEAKERELEQERKRAEAEAARANEQARRVRITRRALVGLGVLLVAAVAAAMVAFNQREQAVAASDARATEVIVRRTAEADAEANASLALTRQAEAIAEGERANSEAIAAIEARETAVFNEDIANHERDRANQQARNSRARELAAQADSVRGSNPQLSILLAIEALKIHIEEEDSSYMPEAVRALRQSLSEIGGLGLSDHENWISDVSFSPDNRWFATASSLDGRIFLWDLTANNPAEDPIVLEGHQDAVMAIAFSPDSQWLATGGGGGVVQDPTNLITSFFQSIDSTLSELNGEKDNAIRLWNLKSSDPASDPVVLHGHDDRIRHLVFSPDNQWLISTSLDKTVRLWEVGSASSPIILDEHESTVQAVAVSTDSRWLATGDESGLVLLWDLGEPTADLNPTQLAGHEKSIWSIDFSHDTRWLATGSADGTARVWDMSSTSIGNAPLVLEGHDAAVHAVGFSPDSEWLVTGSADGTARLWNWSEEQRAEEVAILPEIEGGAVSHILFTPDSRWLITTGEIMRAAFQSDRVIRLWDLEASDPSESPIVLSGFADEVYDVAVSPDGRWLGAGSTDGTARIWHLDLGADRLLDKSFVASPLFLFPHDSAITSVAISPNSQWLATGGADSAIRLWDLKTASIFPLAGQDISYMSLMGHEAQVYTMDISPDNHWLASGSDDTTIRLWDLDSPDVAGSSLVLEGHDNWINMVNFSPDNRWLASASGDGTTRLWDLTADDPSQNSIVLEGHEAAITAIGFSPDGHWLVTGSNDATALVWDLTNTDPRRDPIVLEGHTRQILWLAISSDSRWLATSSADRTARLWDLQSPDPSKTSLQLKGHTGYVMSIAFSPDGRWLATGSTDTTARLWDLRAEDVTKNPIVLTGHSLWIMNVTFSADSQFAATSSLDGTVLLWDTAKPNPASEPEKLVTGNNNIIGMALSSDGRWLVTGGQDAGIAATPSFPRLFLLDVHDLVAMGCHVAGRNLTVEEWEQYFPGEDYQLACEQNSLHPSVLAEARGMAIQGLFEEATARFESAIQLAPDLNINPGQETNRYAAKGLISQGILLSRSIAALEEVSTVEDFQEAIAKFAEAVELDPDLALDPENEVKLLAAEVLRSKALSLAEDGEIEAALQALEVAVAFDPTHDFTASYWNAICWQGGIWDYAPAVIAYCDLAVELAPERGDLHGSRGLVRALTGDLEGAIKDLQFAADWWRAEDPESEWPATFEVWFSALEDGRNPLDQETLESLRE